MPYELKHHKIPLQLKSYEEATEIIFEEVGPHLKLATPLGLGKPNLLLNSIYERVNSNQLENEPEQLDIYTALSLTPPEITEDLGKRFLKPFGDRHWGKDYPSLHYFKQAADDKIPSNIRVHEFYFQSGAALNSLHLQQHYQSVNYTHVTENVFKNDINILVQLIAASPSPGLYSLSCNPDLTLDLAALYEKKGKDLYIVGVVHPDLPYIGGDAEVTENFFDMIVDSETKDHELFALPREPVTLEDYFIGLYASHLVLDGGTLQVGIGSLSEALGAALVLRHQQSDVYQKMLSQLRKHEVRGPFKKGLYGLSEMVTDVFMHLRKAGILNREVFDEYSNTKTYLHGAFFLGSKDFYQWLRDLKNEDRSGLRMTSVSKVNDIYDPHEVLLRRQRLHARFFNTCMQISLLGEAESETLPDAHVVSGIGGQYNFVAMAAELEGARSILLLRSTRPEGGEIHSNIQWRVGPVSIPRHLRDIVITEYGCADIRGKSDSDTIKELLNITDSRFQIELLKEARRHGKIEAEYEIPEIHRHNTPEKLEQLKKSFDLDSFFKTFPFGSDFTPEEEKIAEALLHLKADSKESKWKVLKKVFANRNRDDEAFRPELERLELWETHGWNEKWNRQLILSYLQ
ncbi:MAG: acetyl-CoA hydrolase/transferase C-terminal domain-containing protein [Pseudobdellovibrio sp.]